MYSKIVFFPNVIIGRWQVLQRPAFPCNTKKRIGKYRESMRGEIWKVRII